MEKLEKGIKAACQRWQDLSLANGDPNTIDVLWCADNLYPYIEGLNTQPLDAENYLKLVNQVEVSFIKGLIRTLPQEELIQRAISLAGEIKKENLLAFPPEESVAIALYLWHGCICMAKDTRVIDAINQPYTPQMRWRDYSKLKEEWESAKRMQNPWIERGVSVAKKLSENRNNNVVTDWIPEESPYWK